MKILICSNQFDTVANGPVKFANLISKVGNHDIRILSEDIGQETDKLYKIDIAPWIRNSLLSQVFRMVLYHQKAKEIQKKFPFEVLIYNHALVGLYSAFLFRNTVGMFNDDAYASADGNGFRFSKEQIKILVFRKLEQTMYKTCAKAIVNSDYLKTRLEKAYGSKEKVFKLYKGVLMPNQNVLRDKSYDLVNVLFVKSDYRTGGLQDLILALKMVSFRFCLNIVGPSKKCWAEIKRLLEQAGIADVTTFHGYLPNEQVSNMINDASIFCVPSHRESLGVGNIEALAYGTPVVSTHVGGIPEVLDFHRNGWMAEPQNPVQLAQMLDECVFNPEIREEKIRRGMMYARKFSASNMYKEFIRILDKDNVQ